MKHKAKKNVKVLQDGKNVLTFTTEIDNANVLEVEAGTTGYMGGDSGHGGRTYFRIKDLGSTDMKVIASVDEYGRRSLEVLLGGDCELYTIIEALEYIVKILETMIDWYALMDEGEV